MRLLPFLLFAACETATISLPPETGDDARLAELEAQVVALTEQLEALTPLIAAQGIDQLECQAEVDALQERVGELEDDVSVLWTAVEALYD